MTDENAELLERFQQILKELTFHAREGSSCQHNVKQLLDQLEFEK
jgi:hypothetical protein